MKKINSNIFGRFLGDQQGQFALTAALSAGVMMIAVGAGVDMQRIHTKNMEVQNLIDNAALSAALAFHTNETSDVVYVNDPNKPYYKRVGEKAFNQGDRFDPAEILSLDFNMSNNNTELTGTVSVDHALLFGGFLGSSHKTVSATSVVSVAPAPPGGGGCIIALETNSQGLLLNSGANVEAPDCEVSVHATGNPGIMSNNNVNVDTKKLCLAGNKVLNNGGSLTNLEKDCDVMDNPFQGAFPKPNLGCDYHNGNYNGGNVTLNPGVYCGWFNFNGNPNVTFNPGTYVLKNGGWNVNGGHWEADGVSFYFSDQNSKIQFNSGVSANITAPTSGPYRGVAFFEPDGLGNSYLNLNDSNGFFIDGLIYFPSRNVTFNGGSDLTIRNMSFIVNRLTVNNGDLVLDNKTILTEVTGGSGGGSGGSGGSVGTPYISQ